MTITLTTILKEKTPINFQKFTYISGICSASLDFRRTGHQIEYSKISEKSMKNVFIVSVEKIT